jgi:hypothetical protein
MAETKKAAAKTADNDTPEPANASPDAQRAAESSDPAVHQLLAQRQTAESNEDRDAVDEVDRKLADLGYRA